MKREHKSRQFSCGFLASEIRTVSDAYVWLVDGRMFPVDDLNGREDDEVTEWREEQERCECAALMGGECVCGKWIDGLTISHE